MVNILKVFSTIHKVIDAVEDGKTGNFSTKIGSVKVSIGLSDVDVLDDNDFIIGHTQLNRLWSILMDAILAAFTGTPVSQDWGIDCTKDGHPRYIMMAVTVTL
jgi:transcriptional regulator of met regulon